MGPRRATGRQWAGNGQAKGLNDLIFVLSWSMSNVCAEFAQGLSKSCPRIVQILSKYCPKSDLEEVMSEWITKDRDWPLCPSHRYCDLHMFWEKNALGQKVDKIWISVSPEIVQLMSRYRVTRYFLARD